MGNREFSRLYAEHAQSLYAFLSYRTGNSVLAEDLLADTFERVLRTRRGYDRRRGSERTWLYAIALNCVRDNARRIGAETRALSRLVPAGGAQLEPAFEGLEDRDALHAAIATLSEREREALALRFGADLSLAEVASTLGEPRSKIETRVYRGLTKLRRCLAGQF